MSEHGWHLPAGAGDRFAGAGGAGAGSAATRAPAGEALATYGAAPTPGGPATAPYGVADLPWAWNGSERADSTPPGRAHEPFPGTEFVDLQATLGGQGYEGRPPRTDGLAVLTLVVGMLGVIPWVGLGAIALGHVTLHRLAQRPYTGGRGIALTGTVLGYLTVGVHVLIELFVETLRSFF
ncbi:DUF4190 domain-containing protein [Georgenia sp. Z1491]|uniref:DUF4190 domain-containing protein n=1 Tax=Georgenia sp. Z1491 TaxID=3416707 RepID=UPI003CF5843F